MERIFKNDTLQKRFEILGYVVIPFLDKAEVANLKEGLNQQFPEIPEGFYSTSFSTDGQAKANLSKLVDEIFETKVNEIIEPYRKLGSCFLTKSPGLQGKMPIHQDWTIVDELRFQSVTAWVPLCDVNDENGAMQVIEGSHRFSSAFRSPTLPNPLEAVYSELYADLKSVPMKAGEALIFSQAIMHASPANLSNKQREVVTFGFVPKDAELCFYFSDKKNWIEKYAVTDDFFEKYNTTIGLRPSVGNKIDEFDYLPTPLNKTDYALRKNEFTLNKLNLFTMKRIFKNAEKQKQFEQEGYTVFPLLSHDETNELKQYYESLNFKDDNGFGFHVSMDKPDKNISLQIREKLWGTILPELDKYLIDYKPFVASFVVKDPNPKGVVPAHQDWSFTDKEEDGFCSITCWVALVDTSLENGELGVIKGSHKLMQNHRPSPSPQAPVPLSEHMFSIFPYLKTIDMKAGEVLMFDNRTFHASPPNTTSEVRLAAGVGVTQKDAQLVHYYLKPDGTKATILKYAVDEDFFIHYNNASLSKLYEEGKQIEGYQLLEEVPYSFNKYDSKELISLIKSLGNEYNVPMCEKLAELFDYNADGSTKTEPPFENKDTSLTVEKPAPQSFFEVYTPYNIFREIIFRLTGT